MRPVSDAFLLNIAEVSSALVGLFLVGVFFFVENGFSRSAAARDVMEPYFRSGTRIVLILYAITIGLAISLVALELVWSRWLFLLLSVTLVAANVDSARRVMPVARVSRSSALLLNELLGSVAVVFIVTVPWILGGFHPTREDLTWAILLAFASGFLSISAAVLSAFDISRPVITKGSAPPTDPNPS